MGFLGFGDCWSFLWNPRTVRVENAVNPYVVDATAAELTRFPNPCDTLTPSNVDVSSSASLPSLLYDSESTPVDLTSKIPSVITSEILLKLPVESIVRSRCVSKLWSSITLDPYFINTFETRSATRPSLLMFLKEKDKLFVFSFPHKNLNEQYVESYHMKYPKNCSQNWLQYWSAPLTQSVHGLICFRESETYPVIWNPSTRQLVTLPKHLKKWKGILNVFLGYDQIEGKHKVVCLRRDKDFTDQCRVLTLGSARESWRTIKTNHKHLPSSGYHEQCINGVLYYVAYHVAPEHDRFIMSFDVRTEKLDRINYPSDDYSGTLIPYEGKLACVEVFESHGFILWTLEDAKRHEWSKRWFSITLVRSWNNLFKIVGSTDTGEFICVPRKLLDSFFILYFDPVKNSSRRVDFKGIADENFRLTHGLGSKHLCDFHANANHVETLMSW